MNTNLNMNMHMNLKYLQSLRQRQSVEVESMSVTVGAIHSRLESLVRDNLESSNQAGRGKGSSTYQTRQNVTGALLNKLEKRRKEIDDLAERVVSDGREIIRRRWDDSCTSLILFPHSGSHFSISLSLSLSLSPELSLVVKERMTLGGGVAVCMCHSRKSSTLEIEYALEVMLLQGIRLLSHRLVR